MDPGMIPRLRRGQAEERDRSIAAILIERGILTAEEAHEWRRDCEPGHFGEMIVRVGRLSQAQQKLIEREAALREVMEGVGQSAVPAEVQAAREKTLARVGKYLLVQVLGHGGMGEVWKAWDDQLQRWVAIKFLRGKDPEEVKRFLREAKIASQLSHPGITRVYEAVPTTNRAYIVMEFVDGGSLEGIKRERRRAAEIVREAARAIHYAHEKGIIHRDLKPANLLESKDGRIFVTDLGLARTMAPGGTLTVQGVLLGTPSYMAPEQAVGRPTDRRTDVYGLGATLFALVEGKPPFTGVDNYEIIQKVWTDPQPPLIVQDDLSVIVHKAMEREPADRYDTAGDFADDLDRYLKGDPIRGRPVGTATRMLRRIRRHPVLTTTAGLLVVAIAAGSYFGLRLVQEQGRRERQKKADAEIEKARTILQTLNQMLSSDQIHAEYDRALGDLDHCTAAALTHAPDYPAAQYYRGLSFFHRKLYPAAEESFTRALELDPGYHDARARRGLTRILRWGELPLTVVNDATGFRITHAPFPIERSKGLQEAAADYHALPEEHPDRAYGKALLAFTCGDPVRARETLARIVEARPYVMEARLVLAMAELVVGTPQEAERQAARVYALGDRAAWVSGTLAFARALAGRWEEAVRDAAEALGRDPAWHSLRNCRAFWLQRLQRFPEALAEFDRLVQAGPREVDYRLNRSLLRLRMDDRKGALEDAEEACRLAPNSPRSHVIRGNALDDPEPAIAAFSKAIALDAALPEAYLGRAARLGQTDSAIEDYRKAVDLEPENLKTRHLLALVYWTAHKLPEADQEFGEILQRKADHAEALLYRGMTRVFLNRPLEGNKDVREAERITTEEIKKGRGDASTFSTRAYARAFLLRPKEAAEDADSALALKPVWPELHYDRGAWLLDAEREVDALQEFYTAGCQYLARRDFKSAAACFDPVLARRPEDPGARAGRGRARFALQDFRGALDDLLEAVRLREAFRTELQGMIDECRKRVTE